MQKIWLILHAVMDDDTTPAQRIDDETRTGARNKYLRPGLKKY